MSKLRVCCCCKQREQQCQKLPPYKTQRQQRRFVQQSQYRQNTHSLSDLILNKSKIQISRNVPEDPGNQFMRAVNILRFKISAVSNIEHADSKHISKTQQFWSVQSSSVRNDHGMDTDLDKAFRHHQDVHDTVLAERVTQQPEKFATKSNDVCLEGQLLKFTNVVKGYQNRWFILNSNAGTLQYFKDRHADRQKPRGCINLQEAKVSTLGLDPLTFIVTAFNGDVLKLKAHDDKEKQMWVDKTSAVAEYFTEKYEQKIQCPGYSILSNVASLCGSNCVRGAHYVRGSSDSPAMRTSLLSDAFFIAKEHYREAEDFSRYLDNKILELPISGVYINSLDAELLLLKATSSATLQCVNDCISILQLAEAHILQLSSSQDSSTMQRHSPPVCLNDSSSSIMDTSASNIPNPDDEIPDETVYEDKGFEKSEDHKSVILHLLSQLKLGMDLTKVTLPTFILERRSLLELFTDCMAHPDAFIKIPKIQDPEHRFLAVLEWYLTSFHSGRLGTSAKKPYNPIKGEVFHCSWHVTYPYSKDILLTYTAEQVSHHPPVSAFYVECIPHNIKMNASIYTKSKFMGMSIGVSMIGKVHLNLQDHGEDYIFTMPSAYARSILTVPWVELGDKIQLTCEKTGYLANIIFHTKPFYGGKLHHLTAEAKNVNTGEIVCKVSGEWNSKFEFTYSTALNKNKILHQKEISKVVDVNSLKVYRKYLRPLDIQRDNESRKLWLQVTTALMKNDVPRATEQKQKLENIQREKEDRQRELNLEYEPKFFRKVDGVWLFKTLPDSFAKEAALKK